MRSCHAFLFRMIRFVLFVVLLPVGVTAQTSTYSAPRTTDGHADLQGIWGNNSITPLERPDALSSKETLSAEELARVEATANRLFALDAGDAAFGDEFFNVALTEPDQFSSSDSGTGNYNQFWLVEREFNNRTSLIIDPSDGKLPPTTSAERMAATRRASNRGKPAAWTNDRGLSERCITFGLPNLLAGYNSYYQIFQTADHIVIEQELIHTTRIIPLDGSNHVNHSIKQWHGDSRGRWEGDTLIVETIHFSPQSDFRGAHENLLLTERFTRVGPEQLQYEFTVDDPTTWTAPWTAVVPWTRTDDPIFEYACHEGNIGMEGILAGARADESKSISTR